MFGLEGQKKRKPSDEFNFELEKELADPIKRRSIKQKVEDRLQKIKETLRSGEDQEEFDKFGLLLHGYNAILKVISRFEPKSK